MAREPSVRRDRCAQRDREVVRRDHASLADNVEHRVVWLRRNRWALARNEPARGLVVGHEVRERAPRIDTDSHAVFPF